MILYVPADKPVNVPLTWKVVPPFIEYVNEGVPPDPETVILPVLPPKQLTFVCAVMDEVKTDGSEIVIVVVLVQLFASLTVTVYDPAHIAVAVALV
jgi:hypothetical protein